MNIRDTHLDTREGRLIDALCKGRGCAYSIAANGLYHVTYIGGVSRFAIVRLNIKLFIMWLKKRRNRHAK